MISKKQYLDQFTDKNVIYAFHDPKTNEVRYIGKAMDLRERMRKHYQPSKLRPNTHKNNWVKLLLVEDLRVDVSILDKCEDGDKLNELEIKWIKYYKSLGYNLTNATEGGDGGAISSESIEKMKHTKKINKQIPYWKGKKFTDEHCKNLSESKKGFKHTSRAKENMSEAHKGLNTWSKGKKLSPEHIRKSAESRTGLPRNKKPVYQLDLDGNIIKLWDYPMQAEKELGLNRSKVNEVCKGKRKSTGGFKWVYQKDFDGFICISQFIFISL